MQQWKELLPAMTGGKPLVTMALATQGLRPSPTCRTIGVFWKEHGQKANDSALVEGLDIQPTQQYHRISHTTYQADAMPQEEAIDKVYDVCNNSIVLTYNLPFTVSFLMDFLGPEKAAQLPQPIDIVRLWSFANSFQPFLDPSDISIGYVVEATAAWSSNRLPKIRDAIQLANPKWLDDPALPAPLALVEGMQDILSSVCEMNLNLPEDCTPGDGNPVALR